jgi:hypothetical protein
MFKPKAFHENVKSLLKISLVIYLFMNFTWVFETKTFLEGNATYCYKLLIMVY